MFKKAFWPFLSLLFLAPAICLAHQPRLVNSDYIQINNPEISQAFYGELKGGPVEYAIDSPKDFRLYVGLLVPDIIGANKNISMEIYKDNDLLAAFDGSVSDWQPFYEKFAQDNYWWGPEYSAHDSQKELGIKGNPVGPGKYKVKIFSPENSGKYSLAIGDTDIFKAGDMVNALFLVPRIKAQFFDYSPFKMLSSTLVWSYLIILYLSAFAFGLLYRWLIRKLAKTKKYKVRRNIGKADRSVRLGLAIGFLILAMFISWNPIIIFISGFCLFESIFSWCGLYAALGKNTCPLN